MCVAQKDLQINIRQSTLKVSIYYKVFFMNNVSELCVRMTVRFGGRSGGNNGGVLTVRGWKEFTVYRRGSKVRMCWGIGIMGYGGGGGATGMSWCGLRSSWSVGKDTA